MAVNGVAVGAIGIGAVFLWSAVNNQKITVAIQDILTGKKPQPGPKPKVAKDTTPQLLGNVGAGAIAGSGGSSIVAIALASDGHCYVYGGAPGPDYTGCWDCSSAFSSWATQAGLPIPPGTDFPIGHGPPTGVYMVWTGVHTVAVNSIAKALPGDMIVGPTHMGVYIGNGEYMSAENPKDTTHQAPVSTFPDPLYLVRRY